MSQSPHSYRGLLERAKETLAIGRAFIDMSQEERDNWKGHASMVEQQITECLASHEPEHGFEDLTKYRPGYWRDQILLTHNGLKTVEAVAKAFNDALYSAALSGRDATSEPAK